MHILPPPQRPSGFTLVELLIAAAVTMIGFMAVALLNEANLRCVRSARQSNAATLCLQQRAEQLRLADWRNMTSATYLANTMLATAPLSAAPLDDFTEKVSVEAYPDPTVAQELAVQRNANGTCSTLLSGTGLSLERLARVEILLTWKGADGRSRSRATTTIISNGGISRMNLPAFGSAAGSPPSSSTPAPTATPAPGSTPDPSATPSPATPTPTPSNNGNGNGRGNVGGKPGKN